jgi:putative flippase GtrA
MKRLYIKFICNLEFIRFLAVGGINTIIGFSLILVLYYIGFGYWSSSSISYFLSTFISFFLHRKYSFKTDSPLTASLFKYYIVVIFCYLFSFGISKLFINLITLQKFSGLDSQIVDIISLVIAQCIYVLINYLLQKYWVFKKIIRSY